MYENDRVLVFLCVYQCVCVLGESMDAWTEGGRVVPVNVILLYVNETSYTPLGGTPSSSTTEKIHIEDGSYGSHLLSCPEWWRLLNLLTNRHAYTL